MPSIIAFPGGLKSYLENPTSILDSRPVGCGACGSARAWHCHARRPRYTNLDGQHIRTVVFVVRCPDCRIAITLLPDGLTPWLQHATDTIRKAIEAYVTGPDSYRAVTLDLAERKPPPGETRSIVWGSSEAPTPTPSTLFRWVARFAAISAPWWPLVAEELQQRLDSALRPPPLPSHVPSKGRTDSKQRKLQEAWFLLWVLKALLAVLSRANEGWPRLLTFAPRRPPGILGTSWIPAPTRAPP